MNVRALNLFWSSVLLFYPSVLQVSFHLSAHFFTLIMYFLSPIIYFGYPFLYFFKPIRIDHTLWLDNHTILLVGSLSCSDITSSFWIFIFYCWCLWLRNMQYASSSLFYLILFAHLFIRLGWIVSSKYVKEKNGCFLDFSILCY